MYTIDDLVALANEDGARLRKRTIRKWKEDGLLPTPTRKAKQGQGRKGVPDWYPELALAAVIWLGKYRQKNEGVETTKFWMWMEGFDHIELDKDQLVTSLCQQVWSKARTTLPSLPPLDEAHLITPQMQEAILDEFDENYTRPALDRHEINESRLYRATFSAAQLGLFHGREEVLEWTPDDGSSSSYESFLLADAPSLADDVESEDDTYELHFPALVRDTSIIEVYRTAKAHMIDWEEARKFWEGLKELLTSNDPLSEVDYDVLAFARLFSHAWMEHVASITTMGFMLLEEVLEDPELDPRVRQRLRTSFERTAEHFQQHGFAPCQRRDLDARLRNIIKKYGK